MSDHAGIICTPQGVRQALAGAQALNAAIRRDGIAVARDAEAARAVQWQQMALASEAVLTALDHYIGQGGGSRGARAICDANGVSVPLSARGDLAEFRFRAENQADAATQISLSLQDGQMTLATRPNRTFDETGRAFFERDWPAWLSGAIYDPVNADRTNE